MFLPKNHLSRSINFVNNLLVVFLAFLMYVQLISNVIIVIVGSDSKIKDLVVKFDPDPPKTGNLLTITISGQLGMTYNPV